MLRISFLLIIPLSFIPSSFLRAQTEKWYNECKSTKTLDNLKITFPSEVSPELREYYINENMNSIHECLNIIEEYNFTDSVEVEFLKDRDTMKKYLGWSASGITYPDRKVIFCILAEKNPIKHEWMHMISMLKWGTPDKSLIWLNEGLATYADKCSEYSNEEIYTYFINSDKLIDIDNLTHNFYQQSDVIAYFQAAYIVEYLITRYGIHKFQTLWKSDLDNFSKIYEKSLKQIINDINISLKTKQKTPIELNWDEFEKGCY